MKFRKKEFEIFNLSFLDIISCGFGAVIILVLISKTSDNISISGKDETGESLKTIFSLQNQIQLLAQEVSQQSSKNNLLSDQGNKLLGDEKELTQSVKKKQKEEERKRKKAKLAAMKRKEKQASGELPPPSAEELEKERKHLAQQQKQSGRLGPARTSRRTAAVLALLKHQ